MSETLIKSILKSAQTGDVEQLEVDVEEMINAIKRDALEIAVMYAAPRICVATGQKFGDVYPDFYRELEVELEIPKQAPDGSPLPPPRGPA